MYCHLIFYSVLVLAQCFCLMPVKGIKCKNAENLSFSWRSFRTVSCLLFLVATIIDTGLTCYMVFDQPIQFNKIGINILHNCIV